MSNLKGASEIPIGGMITDAGNSIDYHTGSWASQQPVLNSDKCTGCMFCPNYCPDDCMKVEEVEGKLKVVSIDLQYCKGCGVCASVCNFGAIEIKEL